MQIYIMILTGIMLLFAIVQSIAESMHVRRLANVHNTITKAVIAELTEKKTQLTFTRYQLERSVKIAFLQDNRQQTEKKNLSTWYIVKCFIVGEFESILKG